MYKIKRLSLEKLFSDRKKSREIKNILSNNSRSCKEVIKILELYHKDPQDIQHWLNKVSGYIGESINFLFYYPQTCFSKSFMSDKEIENIFGSNELRTIRNINPNPDYFIESIKDMILTEKSPSSGNLPKYSLWLRNKKDFIFTNSDYIKIFRYISLCLGKQIKPEDYKKYNIWKDRIITNKKVISDKEEIKTILTDCIKNILGL